MRKETLVGKDGHLRTAALDRLANDRLWGTKDTDRGATLGPFLVVVSDCELESFWEYRKEMQAARRCPAPRAFGGGFLALRRVRAGISGATMARRLGISRSYLSNLEAGRRQWSPRLFLGYEEELARVARGGVDDGEPRPERPGDVSLRKGGGGDAE